MERSYDHGLGCASFQQPQPSKQEPAITGRIDNSMPWVVHQPPTFHLHCWPTGSWRPLPWRPWRYFPYCYLGKMVCTICTLWVMLNILPFRYVAQSPSCLHAAYQTRDMFVHLRASSGIRDKLCAWHLFSQDGRCRICRQVLGRWHHKRVCECWGAACS